MSGLVSPELGETEKPALNFSGEKKRRFFLTFLESITTKDTKDHEGKTHHPKPIAISNSQSHAGFC
jgi:hypothetical protein